MFNYQALFTDLALFSNPALTRRQTAKLFLFQMKIGEESGERWCGDWGGIR